MEEKVFQAEECESPEAGKDLEELQEGWGL
jgi:hypothetical protein